MKKVLFVDDDESTLSAYEMAFRDTFEVSTAADGAAAVALLRGGLRPAAVVSDVSMPIMDGRELVKAVAAEFPGTPVILLSGEAKLKEMAEEAGAAGWLTKPASFEDLSKKVGELTGAWFAGGFMAEDLGASAAVYRRAILGSGQSAARFRPSGSAPSAEEMASHVLWMLDEVDRLLAGGDEAGARRHMDFVNGVLWGAGAFSLREMRAVGST